VAEVDDFDMGSRLKSHIANRLQRPRERHVQEAGAAVKSAIFDDIDALRDVDGDEKPAVIGLPPEVTLRRKTTLVTDLFNSFESGQPPSGFTLATLSCSINVLRNLSLELSSFIYHNVTFSHMQLMRKGFHKASNGM